MDIETRLSLIKEVGEEIITVDELRQLLQTKDHPIAYDGFEPSGNLHIAQGILRTINVNKMIKAGCHFKMWVADWFGWMNNKLGGDLEKIRVAGDYMVEVWKACGMKTEQIEFLWAKDVMADDEYWKKVVQIARNSTVQRIIRCSQIMGRKESEQLSAAQIFYPCMQCADIFHLKADITQLGMDQRKVNILAREIGPKLGFWKPVVVSHHMLSGLAEPEKVLEEEKAIAVGEEENVLGNYKIQLTQIDDPAKRKKVVGGNFLGIKETNKMLYGETVIDESSALVKLKTITGGNLEDVKIRKGEHKVTEIGITINCKEINSEFGYILIKVTPGKLQLTQTAKMSKSKPDTAIFMTDSEKDIKRKISKAYCPEKRVEENPILEYCRYMVFEKFKALEIKRPEKFGGDVSIESYSDLEKLYVAGKIHPADLKTAAAEKLNELIEPVREHFATNAKAKKLLEQVRGFEITR